MLQPATGINWGTPFEGVNPRTYEKFLTYHAEHPDIWKLFQEVAIDSIQKGALYLGSKAIFEDVRRLVAERKPGSEFKANNNYHAYYGRAFVRKYPGTKSLFEFRETKGLRNAA